jgi:hypothetical protein
MKQRGRPIRGAVAGFLFGLFISLDLVIFGVFALDADALVLFPVLGIAAGIALGLMAPLRRRSRKGEENPARSPALVDPGPGPSPA